jgi:hypothetical protein
MIILFNQVPLNFTCAKLDYDEIRKQIQIIVELRR